MASDGIRNKLSTKKSSLADLDEFYDLYVHDPPIAKLSLSTYSSVLTTSIANKASWIRKNTNENASSYNPLMSGINLLFNKRNDCSKKNTYIQKQNFAEVVVKKPVTFQNYASKVSPVQFVKENNHLSFRNNNKEKSLITSKPIGFERKVKQTIKKNNQQLSDFEKSYSSKNIELLRNKSTTDTTYLPLNEINNEIFAYLKSSLEQIISKEISMTKQKIKKSSLADLDDFN